MSEHVVVPAAAGAFAYLMRTDQQTGKRPERIVLVRHPVVAWLLESDDTHEDVAIPVFFWGNGGPGAIVHKDGDRFCSDYGPRDLDEPDTDEWVIFDSLDELKADYLTMQQDQWDRLQSQKQRPKKAKPRASKSAK